MTLAAPRDTKSAPPAGMIRSIAGTPAAWRPRRGSFLILVVGTLALLAVVMLVYVSVGNQDARVRAATIKREQLDNVPDQVASYIADQIIAPDRLATTYDDKDLRRPDLQTDAPANEPLLMREITDYPFTPWNLFSDGNNSLDLPTVFTPIGTYVRERQYLQAGVTQEVSAPNINVVNTFPNSWASSDPWLASTEPVALNFDPLDPTDGFGADVFRVKPAAVTRDWAHISNISPDGKFVNLYNLAPVVGGRRTANFDAKGGMGQDNGMPRLATDLSLLVPVNPNNPLIDQYDAGLVTDFHWTVGGNDLGRPAVWDSRQAGLFRPAREWRSAAANPDYGPGGRFYALYQYADADGDGFFDSRWQELTDWRVAAGNPVLGTQFLSTDGRYRYFVAARIIDASALINVNTAGDQAAAPTAEYPVGLTPADIDLLRLLTMRDAYEPQFGPDGSAIANNATLNKLGYDGIKNPGAADPELNTAQDYGRVPGATDVRFAWPPIMDDGYSAMRALSAGHFGYLALRLAHASGQTVPIQSPTNTPGASIGNLAVRELIKYRGINLVGADGVAEGGYAVEFFGDPASTASLHSVDRQDPLGRRYWDFVPTPWFGDLAGTPFRKLFPTAADMSSAYAFGTTGAQKTSHFPYQAARVPGADALQNVNAWPYPQFAQRRTDFYSAAAALIANSDALLVSPTLANPNNNNNNATGPALTLYRSGVRFGMEDLGELLTFRGVSDPTFLSNLERVVDGRDNLSGNNAQRPPNDVGAERYSPLRSNREFKFEMAIDTNENAGAGDNYADLEARQQRAVDIRQRLVTISGSTLLRPVRGVPFDRLTDSELKVDLRKQLDRASSNAAGARARAVNEIFKGYCNALLPHSDITNVWTPASTENLFYRTMFYGLRGPEFAIHTAAHLAVNLADMADREHANAVELLPVTPPLPPPNPPTQQVPYDANVPSAFTLLVSEDARTSTLITRETVNPQNYQGNFFPWWVDRNRLDLNSNEADPSKRDRRLATTTRGNVLAPAVNVYGVEAQPFLTSVSVFTVYADMPVAKGPSMAGDPITNIIGDDDADASGTPAPTIQVDVSRHNADVMYRVLAFQLTNPFNTPIHLGNRQSAIDRPNNPADPIRNKLLLWDVADPSFPAVDREADFFYITFGGRYFKLSALKERVKAGGTGNYTAPIDTGSPATAGLDTTLDDIVIKPHQTIVCYALSQAPRVIYKQRMREVDDTIFTPLPGTPGTPIYEQEPQVVLGNRVRELIVKQLKAGTTGNSGSIEDDGIYWIPEYSPITGEMGALTSDGYDRRESHDPETPVPQQDFYASSVTPSHFVPWSIDRFAFSPLLMRIDQADAQKPNASDLDIVTDANTTPVPPAYERLKLNSVAQLWRALRTGDPAGTNTAETREWTLENGQSVPAGDWEADSTSSTSGQTELVRNTYANDLLVDRIRVPLEPSSNKQLVNLDSRLYNEASIPRNQSQPIHGIDVNDPADQVWIDKTPTIATWAAIRRPADPSVDLPPAAGAVPTVPEGALPAYCLERKDLGDPTRAAANFPVKPWNRWEASRYPDGANPALDKSDFPDDESREATRSEFKEWANRMRGAAVNPRPALCRSIMYPPTGWLDNTNWLRGRKQTSTVYIDPAAPVATAPNRLDVDFPPPPQSGFPTSYAERYPEVILANNNFMAATAGASNTEPPHSTLRVGDVLLPLCVGPSYAPFHGIQPGSDANTDPNMAWTTLGESMCTALGYDRYVRPATPRNYDIAQYLTPVIPPSGFGTQLRMMTDRGNLVLDDFAPFKDINGAANATPVYTGTENGGTDQRRFTQVPIALNVPDMFSVAVAGDESLTKTVPGLININTAPLAVARCLPLLSPPIDYAAVSTHYISINPAAGASGFNISVNITGGRCQGTQTTAMMPLGASPSEVQEQLEAIPCIGYGNVSVTGGWEDPATGGPAVDYVISFVGELSYWAGNAGNGITVATNNPDPSRNRARIAGGTLQPGTAWWGGSLSLDSTCDIAATLIGFRDKIPTMLRRSAWHLAIPGSVHTPVPTGSALVTTVDFGDRNGSGNREMPIATSNLAGRYVQTSIRALSEQPGLPTVGSLLALRHRYNDPTGSATPDSFSPAFRTNIDFMGYRQDPALANPSLNGIGRSANNSKPGLDSVLYGSETPRNAAIGSLPAPPSTPDRTKYDPFRSDALEHEYKEKLAVFNGVANCVTTRSDYYIAWFVLHGYQKSDLEGLGPNDAMVPSVARRFVMVVDRSHVVQRGDKARILLFKELPYKAN